MLRTARCDRRPGDALGSRHSSCWRRPILLFAGVLCRYVFDAPLVWSDELGASLFLWMVSLGAVIALRRGEHMRMTVVVGMHGADGASRSPSRFAALIVAVVALGLLVPGISLLHPAAGDRDAGAADTGIVGGRRASSLALALLLYVALRRLFADSRPRELALVFGAGAAIAACAVRAGAGIRLRSATTTC